MTDFYMKTRTGDFLPVELNSYFTKDLNGKLVIVRVGTDEYPASMSNVDETWESFRRADVLNDLEDVSIIVTPFQIDIGAVNDKDELEDKTLYLQITSGEDMGGLSEAIKKIYKRLSKKFKTVIMPSPLNLREYKKVRDILKRSEIRRERRGRARG